MQMHADGCHSHVIAILRPCDCAILQNKFTQLSTDFERLTAYVSALRSVAARIEIRSEEVSSEKMRNAKCTEAEAER
jgi:hypothetical protein